MVSVLILLSLALGITTLISLRKKSSGSLSLF